MILQKQNQLRNLLTAGNDFAGRFLSPAEIEAFLQFYSLVFKWNPVMNLTTEIEPAEFCRRHLFEACYLSGRIQAEITAVWDLGAGLGIPGVPLAVLRPDLQVTLVEAMRRKAIFLEEVVDRLGLKNVKVAVKRIEDLPRLPEKSLVTARAVDKMAQLLPTILKLSEPCSQLLLLGGEDIALELKSLILPTDQLTTNLVPQSQASYLLDVLRFT